MLSVIDRIDQYTASYNSSEEFYNSNRDYDATMMNFVVLGESVSKISNELKDKYNHIEWHKIYSFRNILAHNYFGVNVDITWQIIKDKIPILKNELNKIVLEV